MVGILVSFWDGLFSGATLVLGRVCFHFRYRRAQVRVEGVHGRWGSFGLPKKRGWFWAQELANRRHTPWTVNSSQLKKWMVGKYESLYIYIWSSPPWFPPTPPPKGGIRHTYAAMYRYNYMFVLIYVCMPVCLSVCLLVCKYVRVPARSTCHCFCVCTQRYYMYT